MSQIIDDIAGDVTTTAVFPLDESITVTIDGVGDQDWYRLDLELGDVLFTSAFFAPGAWSNTQIYDSAGHQVAIMTDFSAGRFEYTFFEAYETGTFYLSSSGNDNALSFPYTYSLNARLLTIEDDVVAGPNTTASLQVNQRVAAENSYFRDRDWYAFEAEAGDKFQVLLPDSLYRAFGDRIAIYDDLGNLVTDQTDGVFELGGTGKYFIEMFFNDSVQGNTQYDFVLLDANEVKGTRSNDHLVAEAFIPGGDFGDMAFGQTLRGLDGDDVIIGSEAADTQYGGNGVDVLWGANGDDSLYGGRDGDIIIGGDGEDRLFGGDGVDHLHASAGDDFMHGGAGADRVFAGHGDDVMHGGHDHDDLFGESGNDLIFGQSGNDYMDGGSGDDRLNGGDGFDVLLGGAGNDRLHGGNGADTFVFGNHVGNDVITDFNVSEDVVDMRGLSVIGDDPYELLDYISEANGDVIFDFGDDSLTLKNIELHDLSADNFIVS